MQGFQRTVRRLQGYQVVAGRRSKSQLRRSRAAQPPPLAGLERTSIVGIVVLSRDYRATRAEEFTLIVRAILEKTFNVPANVEERQTLGGLISPGSEYPNAQLCRLLYAISCRVFLRFLASQRK